MDWLGRPLGGIAAVGVKELRGRMRGRRAFVNLTLYLALLTGFGWMVEQSKLAKRPTQRGRVGFVDRQVVPKDAHREQFVEAKSLDLRVHDGPIAGRDQAKAVARACEPP